MSFIFLHSIIQHWTCQSQSVAVHEPEAVVRHALDEWEGNVLQGGIHAGFEFSKGKSTVATQTGFHVAPHHFNKVQLAVKLGEPDDLVTGSCHCIAQPLGLCLKIQFFAQNATCAARFVGGIWCVRTACSTVKI